MMDRNSISKIKRNFFLYRNCVAGVECKSLQIITCTRQAKTNEVKRRNENGKGIHTHTNSKKGKEQKKSKVTDRRKNKNKFL